MTTLEAIRRENDQLRIDLFLSPRSRGKVCITRGIDSLPDDDKARVLVAVRNFKDFNEDNDPHKEHDFGAVALSGIPKVFWKIDYYENESMDFDPDSTFGGEKSDFINAYRVLTILLASEY